MNKFKRIVSLARKRSHNPEEDRQVIQELLPQYSAIVPEDGGIIYKIEDIFLKNKFDGYALEIGFGSGENIISAATNNKNIGYIGCEVFTGGVIKLLKDIENNNINNIRIWYNDALEFILRIPNNSLQIIYILYPDPWPKKRHHKRRLINVEMLELLQQKLAIDGKLFIVTDHVEYADHIANILNEVGPIFIRQYINYPEIAQTKYAIKAQERGLTPHYFCLQKT